MPAQSITSLDLQNKKVLVRCDFNVPIQDGKIQDSGRIDASLDTIRYILQHGGSAILCSHLGRPKERSPELSLKPIAEYLSAALSQKIVLAPDCIGDHTGKMVEALKPGDALLLENLRFHREEEANDRDFSHELARHKQVYVNDAFGTAHRAHASTVGVTRFIAQRAAGFLMMRELEALRAVTENPERPSIAILGGAKVSDKIGVIKNLITKVDAILIGGAMAYTFLKAKGIAIGRSRVEDDKIELARELLALADSKKVKIVLPSDHIVAAEPEANLSTYSVSEIPSSMMALDIGPRTVEAFIAEIGRAKTVIWNGPLGFFEIPAFAEGTLKVGEALANQSGVKSIIGGGDTAAALAHAPWANKFTHISTGGGATLEYLEGIELPGVKALDV
ncbi:MAG: phosphoglycerate kinase [Candidatus Binatus sp.]|uniref:phosphoglycerate kinase n=1 Tax=Candidatus Binatus sp. TaxID=2811406 RepID=UPI00272792FB|nr:phosphoglycerate kinase [Candidatus Binatus sp.]MDO8431875.1 phosphoglycerate kinase [Candidatus Binatus sp.]